MRYHQITLFGRPFLTDPMDSLDLAKWGVYEKFESGLIRDAVKGKRCLDIGAHIGYVSCLMADAGAKEIHAFEPNPLNFAYLEINTQGLKNVKRAKMGLWDGGERHVQIHLSPVNSGDDLFAPFDDYDRPMVVVLVDNYDHLYAQQNGIYYGHQGGFDFAKIDVQGSELKVLRGMEKELSRGTPLTLAIEYYPDALRAAGDNPPDMLTFLWEKGFKVWEIKEGAEGRLEKVEGFGICDRADLVRGYTNLWCVRE